MTSDDESDEDYVPEGVCKGESRLKQEQSSALSPGKFQTGEWAGRKPKRRKHGKPSALIKVLGLMRCRPKNAEAPDSNLYKEVTRSLQHPWKMQARRPMVGDESLSEGFDPSHAETIDAKGGLGWLQQNRSAHIREACAFILNSI